MHEPVEQGARTADQDNLVAARGRLMRIHAERVVDAATVGSLAHRLVSYLAIGSSGRAPDLVRMREVGRALIGPQSSISRRQTLRTALSLSGVYISCFWPVGAQLMASEFVYGESEFDLIWHLTGGTFQVDELKTGMFASDQDSSTVEQARKQADDGARLLGDAFAGVRVVLLRRRGTFFVESPLRLLARPEAGGHRRPSMPKANCAPHATVEGGAKGRRP